MDIFWKSGWKKTSSLSINLQSRHRQFVPVRRWSFPGTHKWRAKKSAETKNRRSLLLLRKSKWPDMGGGWGGWRCCLIRWANRRGWEEFLASGGERRGRWRTTTPSASFFDILFPGLPLWCGVTAACRRWGDTAGTIRRASGHLGQIWRRRRVDGGGISEKFIAQLWPLTEQVSSRTEYLEGRAMGLYPVISKVSIAFLMQQQN